jgi:competence protein ComEC
MIPWPHAAAAGVVAAALAVAWGVLPLAFAALAAALIALPLLPALRIPLLAFALALAFGTLRTLHDAAATDPWAGRSGEVLTLIATVADDVARIPGAPGLLLRAPGLPDGHYELTGHLADLPGRRNPGGFDARAHWWRRNVTVALSVESATNLAPPGWRSRLRTALRAGVTAGLADRPAALMQALTLGLRDDLGSARDLFAASGLAHVLALSGLHVGLLAAALTFAVGGVGAWRSSAVVALLIGYVLVVGATPAIVRATIMVAVALLARAFGVGGAGWGAHLSLAALVTLLAQPRYATDLGFALSYLSVIGMGLAAAPLTALLATWRPPARVAAALRPRRPPRGAWCSVARLLAPLLASFGAFVRASLAVGVTAQWATASLVASTFGALPLFAPLANLIAVPLTALLVPLGFAAGLLGALHPTLGALVNRLAGPLAEALLATAAAAARLPALPWGTIEPIGHAAFAIASLALLALLQRRLAPWRVSSIVLAAMLLAAFAPSRAPLPEIVALDVGQGDAIVIRLPRAQAVLIDGGGTPFGSFDVGARIVVPALRALGVGALPLVIATHPDTDHVEGLAAVLSTFPVGALLIGHDGDDRLAWTTLLEVAQARGVPVMQVRRGMSLHVGDLTLDVVHPTHAPSRDPNDDSVGVVVRWRDAVWAVLLGDASAAIEATLPVPNAPLLLAPHHGSNTSTSAALLEAVRPTWLWISVGENRYGHPSPAVLARARRAGVEVATTRDAGALRIGFPLPPPPSSPPPSAVP